jgi:cytochrome c peroxidase
MRPVARLASAASALAAGALLQALCCGPVSGGAFDREALARIQNPPLGLPAVPIPPDNPPTEEKIALGRKLFFDRRLSSNNTMSCGMCHMPGQGFTNNELSTAVGVEGRSVRRNSPTIFNVAYAKLMFHDARDNALETQIFGPMLARSEMANPSIGWLLAKIRRLDDYPALFERAFGAGPDVRTLGWALAAYQRSILSGNSPFDRWLFAGEKGALSRPAIQGYRLFTGKAGCAVCHPVGKDYALFTDQALHNTGTGAARDARELDHAPVRVRLAPGVFTSLKRSVVEAVGHPPIKDFGRLEITGNPADLYKYKTPTLRNVALTAPYMHDGSLKTLEEVVRFYNKGGHPDRGLDPAIHPLGLKDAEIRALVAFLESLTGDNVEALVQDARSVPVGN